MVDFSALPGFLFVLVLLFVVSVVDVVADGSESVFELVDDLSVVIFLP